MKQVIGTVLLFGLVLSLQEGVAQDGMSADQAVATPANGVESDPVRPLEIGELCPDFVFDSIINSAVTKAKLSDYKGKLVILDFWSTFCSSCIADFPKKDVLQARFGDKIKILAVVDQDKSLKKIIPTFWNKNKITRQAKLPCVLDEDRLLVRYFPRDAIGLQVWIGPDRKLIGITSAEYVTEKNIKAVLSGAKVKFPINRYEKEFDYNQPLLQPVKDLSQDGRSYYNYVRNFIVGKSGLAVMGSWGFVADSAKATKRLYFVNLPVQGILKAITLNAKQYKLPLLFEVSDSSRFFWNPEKHYYDEWLTRYALSYEAVAPIEVADSTIWSNAVSNLAAYLQADVSVSNKAVKCLVVRRAKEATLKDLQKPSRDFSNITYDEYGNLSDPDKPDFANVSVNDVVLLLNQFYPQYPVVNEIGVLEHSNIYLDNKKTTDLDLLQKELLGQGVVLTVETRAVKGVFFNDRIK